MSRSLSLVRCYGVSFDQDHFHALQGDVDQLLDRVTRCSGNAKEREEARLRLGVEFVHYGDGELNSWMLAASASIHNEQSHLMHVWLPDVGYNWNGLIKVVVDALALQVSHQPRWYYLADYS